MTTGIEHATVVGVFTNQLLAERALSDLHRADFNDEQIGFAMRAKEAAGVNIAPTDARAHAIGATTGAVSGGVAGGLLSAAAALLIPGVGPAVTGGVLAATLSGVVLGAVAGGFVGALQGMGVSEEEAHYYERELESGRIIVAVDAGEREQEVLDILRRNGAYDASAEPDAIEEIPTQQFQDGYYRQYINEYDPNIPFGSAQ
jgi:hypothetical protein